MKRHAALVFVPPSLLLVVLSLTTGAGFGQTAGHAAEPAPSAEPSTHRIRPGKTAFADTTPGVITTVVADKKCQGSSCGVGGDGGPAADAHLSGPCGVFLDPLGNLLIAEALGHRIRRVDSATGTIATVAGNPRCFQGRCDGFFSGDGGLATAAELNIPSAVVTDAEGNLFISDMNNNRIRRVDKTTGIITTVVGSFRGFSGDGGPARNAELNAPWGLAIDAAGNLFIADSGNARIPARGRPRWHYYDSRGKRSRRLKRRWSTCHRCRTAPAVRSILRSLGQPSNRVGQQHSARGSCDRHHYNCGRRQWARSWRGRRTGDPRPTLHAPGCCGGQLRKHFHR